jgi:tetratricopeptide (TPR) repeat protein
MRAALVLILSLAAVTARAEPEGAGREASRHFQRGVDLYNEGDLRGALVEFKKANTMLPRASVLYNIGQTEYQLQEYAQALRTLERFLAETGPSAAHRGEVEETVEVLRGRVGKIALTADRAECEVTVDDQPAGTTPLPQPVVVSIGRRRIALTCGGRPLAAREVDVAAGELLRIDLRAGPAPASAAAPSAAPAAVTLSREAVPPPPPSRITRSTANTAWIVTAGLAAATVGVYVSAIVEARQLDSLRHTYPITTEQLEDKRRLTSRLALAGDVLAATTVVAAGVSAFLGWNVREERGAHLAVGPGGLSVSGRF